MIIVISVSSSPALHWISKAQRDTPKPLGHGTMVKKVNLEFCSSTNSVTYHHSSDIERLGGVHLTQLPEGLSSTSATHTLLILTLAVLDETPANWTHTQFSQVIHLINLRLLLENAFKYESSSLHYLNNKSISNP